MQQDYYKILGINKGASDEEIKKAYKKMCLKYHPDRFAGYPEKDKKDAEEKFKDVQEAYNVLSDPDKKQFYDNYGTIEGFDQNMMHNGAGFPGFDGFPSFEGFSGFGNMFNDFFGNTQNNQANNSKRAGQSIKTKINVNIDIIMSGGEIKIKVPRKIRCTHCNGIGGENEVTCNHCHGTGMMTTVQQTPFGIIQNSRPCPHCNATGKVVKNKCTHCNGEGFIIKNEEITINIPSNIENGHIITITGKGHESKTPNMPNGDLIVIAIYNIDENKYSIDPSSGDVYEKIDVPYYDCILGTSFDKTLPNKHNVKVDIPEKSKEGTLIKIQNEGLKISKFRNYGSYNLIIHPSIEPLNDIKDTEIELLQKIKKIKEKVKK